MLDPLTQYHTALRSTRSSGYPNMQFLAPHPYELARGVADSDRSPFAYSIGHRMRLPLRGVQAMRPTGPYRSPVRQDPAQRFSPGLRTPYIPAQPQQSSGRYEFLDDWQGGFNRAIAPQRSSFSGRDRSYLIP